MSQEARLEIWLAGGAPPPVPGAAAWNEHRGGPEVLLRWLETQLGLLHGTPSLASRILEYAAALDAVPAAQFAASLQQDRWATAGELLARRDELRLAGWDEQDAPALPPLWAVISAASSVSRASTRNAPFGTRFRGVEARRSMNAANDEKE